MLGKELHQFGKNYKSELQTFPNVNIPSKKQFKIWYQSLSHMLGSISIEVIIEVLRENIYKEMTMGHLEVPAACLGQGKSAEKMIKATTKKRHWIGDGRNGNENW